MVSITYWLVSAPRAKCYHSFTYTFFVILQHRKYISVDYPIIRNFLFKRQLSLESYRKKSVNDNIGHKTWANICSAYLGAAPSLTDFVSGADSFKYCVMLRIQLNCFFDESFVNFLLFYTKILQFKITVFTFEKTKLRELIE